MSDPIRLIVNGETVEVRDAPPTTTLLDWLRETRGLTGTKEGCAEGDCGACTVVVRERGPDGALRLSPVNACIQLLPMMHGREVVTVEHLSRTGAAHPVQTAMAEGHGSQCGFCTPGFVMSLWRAYEAGEPTDRDAVATQIAGNLCRCTGYGPILNAAKVAAAAPRPASDADDAAARLAALDAGGLDYRAGGARFRAPATADEAAEMIADDPEATILAGATDIGLWVTKRGFAPTSIIHLAACAELDRIDEGQDGLTIHAAVTHQRAMDALARLWPDMGEMWRRFGSVQVRSAGTLCGNVANGSPIGDAPPALIAAGAEVVLRRRGARRVMPLEDFFIDYGKQDRAPGEFVEAVRVPSPQAGQDLRVYKISKRFEQDITSTMAAINLTVTEGRIAAARIAFGGMAATPKRAAGAEAVLTGAPFEADSFKAAMAALGEDFTPIDDMRASAAYRMAASKNLIWKYWLERSAGAQRVTGPDRALRAAS